jgi:hypothetical protein
VFVVASCAIALMLLFKKEQYEHDVVKYMRLCAVGLFIIISLH